MLFVLIFQGQSKLGGKETGHRWKETGQGKCDILVWMGCGRSARLLLLVPLAACGGGDVAGPPTLPGADPPPCMLASKYFIVDAVELPAFAASSSSVTLDLDGDGVSENTLGNASGPLHDGGADVPSSFADAVAGGQVLWVIEIARCRDGTGDHVRVASHRGASLQGDLAAGTATIALDASLDGVPAVGSSTAPNVDAREGVGSIPASALFDVAAASTETSWVAGAELTIAADETSFALAGLVGLGLDDLAPAAVAPALARSLSAIVATDRGCPGACQNSVATWAVTVLDLDHDNVIAANEILANEAVARLIFAPDLDVFADGQYWPDHDGIDDHLSLVLGFHAVSVGVR